MSAPRRQCPNCGVLTYGTHTFAECIEALREALMASEEDASEVHATALASARAEGAAEAFERAAKAATPEWLRAAYYYTNPDTAERDHHRAPDISAWRNVAAAISALAREAAKEDRS